ncbi:MAG: hypothetical protein U5K72_05335 [Balneolaceae bacterium]|nr:hypothetical protein [Balneolaceae bacterium]
MITKASVDRNFFPDRMPLAHLPNFKRSYQLKPNSGAIRIVTEGMNDHAANTHREFCHPES